MIRFSTTTAKSARALRPLALLGVIVMSGFGAWVAFAAPPTVPTPTITSSPANPTTATSASFTYSSSGATSYSCKRDSATAFAACPNTGITYSGLAEGSHTFQVQAIDKQGRTSSPASYTWVIDRTAPAVSSIARADANPTKATPVRWTVTFSEAVKNLTTANFALVKSNLGGTSPTLTSVTSSGSAPSATWTVTASTSGATGANDGSLGLNLTSKGSIQDSAGNALGGTVPIAGQAYTFDTTAPTTGAVTIAATGSSPTNSATVSWTVTFGEAMTGVAAGNFSLTASGFSGTPAITSVTGSGTMRTVTASTGSGTPAGTATLQLKLSTAGGVADVAGNALSGSLPVTGSIYTLDRLAPSVAFGTKPPNPNTVSNSTFTWSSSPAAADFDRYECSVEKGSFDAQVPSAGGSPQPCSSPLTYVVATTNNGQHQFDVRAYDHLGNFTQITYSWKVAAGSIQDFAMSGNLAPADLLYPGGATRSIPVTFDNPNGDAITVTAFTVSVDPATLPSGCLTSWFPITQSNIASTAGVVVAGNGSVTLPSQGVTAPTVRMTDSGNQDACRNATFTLRYTDGNAHS